MGNDLGYGMADRLKNAQRLCRMPDALEQGLCRLRDGVAFAECHAWNQAHLARYVEVYVRVKSETLISRDQKGLVAKALRGAHAEVVGFDQPFDGRPPPPRHRQRRRRRSAGAFRRASPARGDVSGSTTIAFGTKAEHSRGSARSFAVRGRIAPVLFPWSIGASVARRRSKRSTPLRMGGSAGGEKLGPGRGSAATSRAAPTFPCSAFAGPPPDRRGRSRRRLVWALRRARPGVDQTETRGVRRGEVLMSRDLDTLAPYYVLNYDDATGSTDSVTSGRRRSKTYVRFRDAEQSYPR